MNWQRTSNVNKRREKNQDPNGLFSMLVENVAVESDAVSTSFYGTRNRTVRTPHPYIGPNSWIRAQPEKGSEFIGSYRRDSSEPVTLTSFAQETEKRIEAYKKGIGYFRPLFPGEVEISSVGRAGLYLPRRSIAELKAGALSAGLNQDRLESFSKAPTHSRFLLSKIPGAVMGDEERLGVVYRQKTEHEIYYPKVDEDFACERYLNLKNSNNTKHLLTEQAGHVFGDSGQRLVQTSTGIPLRYRHAYYSNDQNYSTEEIDEDGNVYKSLPIDATDGYRFVVPKGSYRRSIGVDEQYDIQGNQTGFVAKNGLRKVGDNEQVIVDKSIKFQSTQGKIEMVFDSGTLDSKGIAQDSSRTSKFYVKTKGHLFALDDTKDKEAIYLYHVKNSGLNFDKDGGTKLFDGSGNVLYFNAKEKTASIFVSTGAMLSIGKGVTIKDANGNFLFLDVASDKLQISTKGQVNVDAATVTLGRGTEQIPLVLARQLSVWLDAHTHGYLLGSTTPPLLPSTVASLLPPTDFQALKVLGASNI